MKTTQKIVIICLVLGLFGALLTCIASADTYLHPTVPGTTYRDYERPSIGIDDFGSVYKTVPGTNYKDYNEGGYKVEGDRLIPTLPGTNATDYESNGYSIDFN